MGNVGTKVSDFHEATCDLRRDYVLARIGLFPFVLAGNVVMGVFHSFMAPPERENSTVHVWRAQWKVKTKAALERHKYRKDRLHFAVCGSAGSGKSTLINAFRGLKGQGPGTAPVGIVETTTETRRYPDTRPGMPYELFVWYDVPGAGTVDVRSTQYFEEQGLFIFDFIILVYDIRFTDIDAKILEDCRKFGIPTFVVRSKANQHISNMRLQDDELTYEEARDQYVLQTRQNFKDNLKKLDLYDEESRCYIVSATNMYGLIKSVETTVNGGEPAPRKNADEDIDEVQLLADLFKTAFDRRYKE